jgi:hypothetical protein
VGDHGEEGLTLDDLAAMTVKELDESLFALVEAITGEHENSPRERSKVEKEQRTSADKREQCVLRLARHWKLNADDVERILRSLEQAGAEGGFVWDEDQDDTPAAAGIISTGWSSKRTDRPLGYWIAYRDGAVGWYANGLATWDDLDIAQVQVAIGIKPGTSLEDIIDSNKLE